MHLFLNPYLIAGKRHLLMWGKDAMTKHRRASNSARAIRRAAGYRYDPGWHAVSKLRHGCVSAPNWRTPSWKRGLPGGRSPTSATQQEIEELCEQIWEFESREASAPAAAMAENDDS